MPSEDRETPQIGMIPVDAIYTPVTKVSYSVEHTRVGQLTNYDRSSLDVWTDGTITPEDAVGQSAAILVNHLSLLVPGQVQITDGVPEIPGSDVAIPQRVADTPIEELDLSVRAYNCLKRSSITRLGQVLRMTDEDLLNVRHFGRKSLDELYDRLLMRASGEQPSSPFGLLGDLPIAQDDEEE